MYLFLWQVSGGGMIIVYNKEGVLVLVVFYG